MAALPITEEDRALIRPLLVLPMVEAAFVRDSRIFQTLQSPEPYVDWLTQARERLAAEVRAVKAQVYRRGIRIVEQQRVKDGFIARYQCRGHHGDFVLRNEEIAKEAAEMMRTLLTF